MTLEPTDPRAITVRIEGYGDLVSPTQTGSAWFDDVRITALPVDPLVHDELNILTNPSFEQNLMLWDSVMIPTTTSRLAFSVTTDPSEVLAGGKALRVTVNSQAEPMLSTDDPLILSADPTSERRYNVSAAIKVVSGAAKAAIRIYGGETPSFNQSSVPASGPSTQWQRVSVLVKVPPGVPARHYLLKLEAYGDAIPSGQQSVVIFDDIKITSIP